MNEVVVNIRNRCNRRCKCKGKRQLTTYLGAVKGIPGFGYCTHEANGTSKISNATWKGIDLDRVDRGLRPFEGSESLTVFYYSKLDGQEAIINKPLLVRSRYDADKIHWYENVCHYANKKWKRISTEAQSGSYPTEDNYSQVGKFGEKLKSVACRLFASHYISIDSDKGDNRKCQICGQQISVDVSSTSHADISGYTKYEFTGTFSDKSILVFKENKITYRRQHKGFPGYYLPIQLDTNIEKVVLYYWNGDDSRKNPLLIELVGTFGFSYWFENISNDGKHDKWKPIGHMESKGFDSYGEQLKKRLNVLNCVYNGVVQINVGEKKGCHDTKHYLHKHRIGYGYGEEFGTSPVLYAYRYRPDLSSGEKFINISDVSAAGISQNLPDLPFRSVTNFIVYVSPCFKDKPFLICVESNNRKNYKWYKRNSEDGIWEEYLNFNYMPPSKVKNTLGGILDEVKKGLGIGECNIQTKKEGVKLDITRTLPHGQSSLEYYDNSMKDRKVPIFLTKSKENILSSFFRNNHRVNSNSGTFVMSNQLQGQGRIVARSKIESVRSVEVYFWNANYNMPILLEITTKTGTKSDTKYYGKLPSAWGQDQVENMNKQQALDHQNCVINDAIPIDLKEPTNFDKFHSEKKQSHCLRRKHVKLSDTCPTLPSKTGDYIIESYNIIDSSGYAGKTRISRVTYGYEPTDIITTNDIISNLRIYKWTSSEIPLVVEFVKDEDKGSIFFENLGKTKNHTEWRTINDKVSKEFYDSDNLHKLTEVFSKKLDEVNCRVNKVLQLDISHKNGSYCHGLNAVHSKRIRVSRDSQGKYQGFIGYLHESAIDKEPTFSISSIYNGQDRQKIDSSDVFPLYNVKKAIIYFPVCDGALPVAISIEKDGSDATWLKRISTDKQWEVFYPQKDSMSGIEGILEKTKEMSICNIASPVPRFSIQQPYVSSQGSIPSIQDDDEKVTLNDIFQDTNTMDEEVIDDLLNDEYEDADAIEELSAYSFVSTSPTPYITQLHRVNDMGPGSPSVAPLSSHGVIIDIKKSKDQGQTYQINGKGKVYLERYEDPEKSGFYILTHESYDEIPFRVDKVEYEQKNLNDIRPTMPINSFSVWYWKGDIGMINPLLVESRREDGQYDYNYNKGNNNWDSYKKNSPKLLDEEIETKLDELSCQLNHAVTMDISHDKLGQYCCGKHNKISVKKGNIRVNTSNFMDYNVHFLSSGKLSKIKYYVGKTRQRIQPSHLGFPIDTPVDVYVYYCGNTPAVIYLKNTRGSSETNRWYKRENPNNHNWIDASKKLNTVNGDQITCESWNKLRNVLGTLGCGNLLNCNPDPHGNSTSINIISTTTDPELSILLSNNPKGDIQDTTQYSDHDRIIFVKRTNEGSDFYKFTHYPEDNKLFKLIAIKDDSGIPISPISGPGISKITSVSAYYWQHKTDKVLLVEVASEKYPKYYCAKDSENGDWKSYTITTPGSPSPAELDLLNCEINDVVQIDVTRITDYCHDSTNSKSPHKKKVKVVKVGDLLGNYTACVHIPNRDAIIDTFNISTFKNGQGTILTGLSTPLLDAKKVVVYFCKNSGDPLLIYVAEAKNEKWFKKPTTNLEWESVNQLNGKNDSDTQTIVHFLDTLSSPCKPPSVIIDVYKGTLNEQFSTYTDETYVPSKIIEVEWVNPRSLYDFNEYIHQVQERVNSYFTLQDVNYNGKITHGIRVANPLKNVMSVSVYYWTHLEKPHRDDNKRGRPLLVKVTQQNPTGGMADERYYENISTSPYYDNINWNIWKSPGTIQSGELEAKLHLLNCRLNNAVIVDVSKQDDGKSYDVCEKDTNLDPQHGERTQVNRDTTSDN